MSAELTESSLKQISSLSKHEGKNILGKMLNIENLDDDENLRKSIYVDFLYDNAMFAVDKGFSWSQVSAVTRFCDGLLKETEGKDLTDALHYLKLQSFELADVLGSRNFPIYTDFVFTTFMRHFKLFQYVFTKERENLQPNVQLCVNTPEDMGEMKKSRSESVWEYEKRYEDILRDEAVFANHRTKEKERVIQKLENENKTRLEEISKIQEPLTKESVGKLIGEVLGCYTSLLVEKVKCDVKDVTEDLEFKLQRTSLPRPQTLGPPPRFNLKPKTPISTPKTKVSTPKSPKSERRKSASRPKSRNTKA